MRNLTNIFNDDDNEDDDCDGSGQPLWFVGVVLGLIGSVCINMGNNFQSLGMHQLAEENGSDNLKPFESRVWRVGTVIFVCGALLNFASYAFAAQSMLASLEAVQFVTNIIFSKFMLKKTITWRMCVGTAMICAGTVLAVINSSREELCATARDLVRNYTHNLAYQVFLVATIVFGIVLQGTYVAYQRSVDVGRPLPGFRTVLPVTYAAFSALFGTQSVVQAKCLAELLQAAMPIVYPVFLHWFTYAALAAWIGLVAVWLRRMNDALGLYDPIFIIPLLQVDFIFFAIVAGGIYFREFDDFTPAMWIGFTTGIVVIFVGLFLLAPSDQAKIDPRLSLSHRDSHGRFSSFSVANTATLVALASLCELDDSSFEKPRKWPSDALASHVIPADVGDGLPTGKGRQVRFTLPFKRQEGTSLTTPPSFPGHRHSWK
ncbi:hypothetical protein CTAYLR_000036 [Chrysophaeum taylorii]|uniref:Magnesium transporter n=1 Tax=Chrysophaeum taylorii TaxID=2483200 RepID=A0AAD7UGF3_9STRA|nr:hypothetical protein CTAYLR_000036 [Chrysophaeum taylorii]